MKRLFIASLLVLVGMTSQAQNTSLKKAIGKLQSAKNVSTISSTSEQGHDRIDSLYYLNTKTYALPYKSKKERAVVDGIVNQIIEAYDKDLPRSAGGFSHSTVLDGNTTVESERISMYYAENKDLFIIGGTTNYALLRIQDKANPKYRRVDGVEWHMSADERVIFRTFHVYGPMTESLYSDAVLNSGDRQASFGNNIDDEALIEAIEIMRGMYNNNNDNAMDRAIIQSINGRVERILSKQHPDNKELIRLFRELDKIPGYYAETKRGIWTEGISFGALAERYPSLNVKRMTYSTAGDPNTRRYGDRSKNFLLVIEVY